MWASLASCLGIPTSDRPNQRSLNSHIIQQPMPVTRSRGVGGSSSTQRQAARVGGATRGDAPPMAPSEEPQAQPPTPNHELLEAMPQLPRPAADENVEASSDVRVMLASADLRDLRAGDAAGPLYTVQGKGYPVYGKGAAML